MNEEARGRGVDAQRVDAILDRLHEWKLVEEREGHMQGTRRWNAKLQAAAEKLNLIEARTGQRPAGNPLVVAASQALANENLGVTPEEFDEYVRVLVLVELSRMTPAKRASLGFADVLFPGESPAKSGSTVEF